jgi:hypothetical protein
MVFGANMELYGGSRWGEITGVETLYFKNMGDALHFKITSSIQPRDAPIYMSFDLFALDCALAVLLPSTTIKGIISNKLESTYLINNGYGTTFEPDYIVFLGQRGNLHFIYEIYLENLSKAGLYYDNTITQLLTPSPISLVF